MNLIIFHQFYYFFLYVTTHVSFTRYFVFCILYLTRYTLYSYRISYTLYLSPHTRDSDCFDSSRDSSGMRLHHVAASRAHIRFATFVLGRFRLIFRHGCSTSGVDVAKVGRRHGCVVAQHRQRRISSGGQADRGPQTATGFGLQGWLCVCVLQVL